MGFDLYGMNPRGDIPEPKWTKEDPYIKTGENSYAIDPQIKEEHDDYMKSRYEWQESTNGAYFRNNVWFWRPLWNFVTAICDDILTRTDIESGSYNDGHKISKTKAKRMAVRLDKLLNEGDVAAYESAYRRNQDDLNDTDWDKSYPFSEENVREFASFCANSGGFQIW